MALSILDGNQSATTLSTILSSGQHITAHTVVSLGTQAITDIVNATSAGLTNTQLRASAVTVGGTVTVGNSVTVSSLPAISGTVTASVRTDLDVNSNLPCVAVAFDSPAGVQRSGIGNAFPIRLDSGVTLGAGTSQIGSVTIGNSITIGSCVTHGVTIANSSVTVNGSFFQATQPVSLTTLPALVAGTAQIGTVTVGNISSLPDSGGNAVVRNFMFGYNYDAEMPVAIASDGTALSVVVGNLVSANLSSAIPAGTNRIGVVTIGAGTVTIGAGTAQIGAVTASLAISSTAITSGSFASLTSATLVPGNVARKMATVYNLGAGQLFINAGATATTLGGGFMVALSSGDFYECDYTTTTLSAIFATAGTASWMSH